MNFIVLGEWYGFAIIINGHIKVMVMKKDLTQQLEFFAIPSPCKGICESNSKGYCKGCQRSRQERVEWLHLSDSEKKHVLALCILRRRKWQSEIRKAQLMTTEANKEMTIPFQTNLNF